MCASAGQPVAHIRAADARWRDSDRAAAAGARGAGARRGAACGHTAAAAAAASWGRRSCGVVAQRSRPLKRVATEVQRRDVHSLAPIARARLPQEVAPLVQELNRLLERLNAAFQTQRAFIADAAHELRSPLTAVRLRSAAARSGARRGGARRGARQSGRGGGARDPPAWNSCSPWRATSRAMSGRAVADRAGRAAADGIADTHALAVARRIELEPRGGARRRGAGRPRRAAHPGEESRSTMRCATRRRAGACRCACGSPLPVRCWRSPTAGPGFRRADRERAFDRFYRRANAPEGGSGLGPRHRQGDCRPPRGADRASMTRPAAACG